jgi:hypothetical protein
MGGKMTVFWISFLDDARPVGRKSTGVVIVEADEPDAALASIAQQKLHPGGEATIEDITHRAPPPEWFNRILSGKEARDVTRLMCIASQDRYEDDDD